MARRLRDGSRSTPTNAASAHTPVQIGVVAGKEAGQSSFLYSLGIAAERLRGGWEVVAAQDDGSPDNDRWREGDKRLRNLKPPRSSYKAATYRLGMEGRRRSRCWTGSRPGLASRMWLQGFPARPTGSAHGSG
ncbi:MAG: hypothetical protein WKH64_11850 [Chloroflexia bacterium]